MRKVLLVIGTLFLSVNAIAATTLSQNLGSAISSTMKSHNSPKPIKSSFPLVYGGEDISRPLVATANESVWSKQSSIVD